jgi:hypothetical protein
LKLDVVSIAVGIAWQKNRCTLEEFVDEVIPMAEEGVVWDEDQIQLAERETEAAKAAARSRFRVKMWQLAAAGDLDLSFLRLPK